MEINKSVLDNGLSVLTARLPGFQSSSIGVFVNRGSRHEEDHNSGVAHFLEHMAFKGTTSRSAKDIADAVEYHGASINASTSDSRTAYYVSGLCDVMPTALDILSDVIQNSVFDQKEIDSESNVIQQEYHRSNDNPNNVVWRNFARTAFPNQPLGREILGSIDFIQNAKTEDFRHFVDHNYKPSNMSVAFSGDIPHDEIVSMVNSRFGRMVDGVVLAPVPANYVGGVSIDSGNKFEQVTFMLGFEAKPCMHDDFLATGILSEILGGAMSAPLFQEVREKRGLVYSIGSWTTGDSDHGLFVISGGTTSDKVAECLKVSIEEMHKLATSVVDRDFERAKNSYMTHIAMGKEKPMRLISNMASDHSMGLDVTDTQWLRNRLSAVTKDDVMRVAAQLNKPTLSLVGPVDTSVDYESIIA